MRQLVDPVSGVTFNMIDPDKKKTIWDPNSEFMKELEIYKLKSEIKPRKVDMMASQVGMIKDFMGEDKPKKLYVPMNKGFVK
jgi:hypothetical protein